MWPAGQVFVPLDTYEILSLTSAMVGAFVCAGGACCLLCLCVSNTYVFLYMFVRLKKIVECCGFILFLFLQELNCSRQFS